MANAAFSKSAVTGDILLLGPCLLTALTARTIKFNRKAAEIIQPIIENQNHAASYLRLRQHINTHTHPHESDSKNQVHAGPADAWLKSKFASIYLLYLTNAVCI